MVRPLSIRVSKFRTLAVLTMLLSTLPVEVAAQPQNGFVAGRLLVRFRETVNPDNAKNILRSLQASSVEELKQIRVHIVQLPPNASEKAYENVFRQRADVEFAELDRIVNPGQASGVVPNDPHFNGQWHLSKIGAPTAWNTTTGSPNVIIAIADSGVDATHPDLASKMVAGWNVNDNNSDTRDVYGHGTKVAGTAAAASNNALGVASVAWNCWIMPVRVTLTNGSAYTSTIAKGITWAADHGARVVNASFDVTNNSTVSSAAKYMYEKGGVVTISAGNSSTFDTFADNPYILTVGGTDQNDLLYSWSDYGNPTDVVAPGCVTTTANGGGYTGACGTSFAAPTVAGVAALVMSANPGLTAAQVINTIQKTADDLGPAGWDSTFGHGRVNAAKAVGGSTSPPPPADTTKPTVAFASPGNGAVLSGTTPMQISATDNVGVASITVTANGALIGSSTSFGWNTTAVANGSYTLVATAKDAAGNASSASIVVSVNNTSATSDTTPPAVSITSPQNGAIVSGNVSLTVKTTDNVGVVRVEYFVDGQSIAAATAAPFSTKWNARRASKGSHIIHAKAFDGAGNSGTSAAISVTVQ